MSSTLDEELEKYTDVANHPTAGRSSWKPWKPQVPAQKPEDKELMKFVALDDILVSADELKRQKLASKRKEFLKTDLTWKQVIHIPGSSITPSDSECNLAFIYEYEYICKSKKIFKISKISNSFTFEDTGLVEADINEIL